MGLVYIFCMLKISTVVLSSFQENPYQIESITNVQVKIVLSKIDLPDLPTIAKVN